MQDGCFKKLETDLIRMYLGIDVIRRVHLKLSGILEQRIRENAEKYQHCSVKDPCIEVFFLHSRCIYCTIIKLTIRKNALSVLTDSFFYPQINKKRMVYFVKNSVFKNDYFRKGSDFLKKNCLKSE